MTLRWPVVLFDFDGTLADTIPLILASYRHAFSTIGSHEVDEAEMRSWIGRPLLAVLEESHPEHAEHLVREYRTWNLANHDDLIESVPGVAALIEELHDRGARTGVVSSKIGSTVRLGLAAVGLEGAVDVLAGQEETSRHKPHPEPLLYAAGQLGVDPSACVYVGDATVDIKAARAAGMAGIGVTWGAGEPDQLRAEGAVAVVDSVEELRAVLTAPTQP